MMPPDHNADATDESALQWATLLDGGQISPDEQSQLQAWLDEDPAHALRLDYFQAFFAQMQGTMPAIAVDRYTERLAQRRRVRRQFLVATASLATAACLALAFFWAQPKSENYSTATAQRQSVALRDGSRVDVNARTVLSVTLGASERRIRLERGEAYFSVASDPARPFMVETHAGRISVLGTQFNVRVDDDGRLQVTVAEGTVAAQTSRGDNCTLNKNAQMVSDRTGLQTRILSAAATEDVLAWREGKVVFDDTPLGEAVGYFAAYHQRRVTIAPELANEPMGGRYSLDSFDKFLGSLSMAVPKALVQVDETETRIVSK